MQYTSNDLNNATTLEEVQDLFQKWRNEKPAQNSHTPDYLWDHVARIVERYPHSDILKYLKITRHQLVGAMKYQQKPQDMDATIPTTAATTSQEIPNKITPDSFIKVSMPITLDPDSQPTSQHYHPTPHPTKEQNDPKIELIHPNGITMRMTNMRDSHISSLISSFIGRG